MATKASQLSFPNDRYAQGFHVLLAVFVGSYVIAPLLAMKLIPVGPFVIAAGAIAYSVTFPVTDLATEIYGDRHAKTLVRCGFVAMLTTACLTQLCLHWPAAESWQNEDAFNAVFGTSYRIFLASITAYLTAQHLDIWIFARIKSATHGRWLWLRNNGSTFVSKLVDTLLFMTIGFYGTMANDVFWRAVMGMWVVHVLIALLDTPFVYAGVALLRAWAEREECDDAG